MSAVALRAPFGLSEFKFYYEIFYPARDPSLEEGKECARRTKRVPENIHDLLTARALAYWFMDDGNSDQNGRRLLRPPIGFQRTLFL